MSHPTTATEALVSGLTASECPRWHDEQLYISDMHARTVLAVAAGGATRVVAEVPGGAGGLGWLPDNSMVVVSQAERRVLRVDADGGVHVHADLTDSGESPLNDVWVDGDARAYVGEMGFDVHAFLHPRPDQPKAEFRLGRIYAVEPTGEARPATAEGLRFPNGIVTCPVSGRLVVAESFGFAIASFERDASGSLTNAETWAQLTFAPDGIAADRDGCLWVADPAGRRAVRVAPGGEELEVVTTDQQCLSVALGGSDGRALFLCTTPSTQPDEARRLPAHTADAGDGRVQRDRGRRPVGRQRDGAALHQDPLRRQASIAESPDGPVCP
ncbi:SMP-30/gluconolactonase/LRE family protein [Dactylosporangium sucinum]|uniref:Gluconolaconase n=1 Tax=Dactylosporangium sucinum TaxID=1424081 RepID=A0A917UHR4_9ACTN|nr:SMP-30/gluconolactonase/LRE family protein [Dactylosporangium sucinum]GGM89789.1 gluconolaconase [Dactylosporangium sucinum]